MEIWKDVLGLEQYYEVSNFGNIKSKVRTGITNFGERTYGGKVVKPFLSTVGYPAVNLTYKGYRKQFHVHKLVLEAFNGKAPEGMEGCHNNGVKTDCYLTNLRWDTRKNNHADKKLHGTHQFGEKIGNSKLTTEQAILIKYSKIPMKKLCAEFNLSLGCISKVRYGATWKHI